MTDSASIAIVVTTSAFADVHQIDGAQIEVHPVSSVATVHVTPLGERGPPGPQGLAAGYLHTQSSANATWTINHNLGFKPSVHLYTVGGLQFDGQIVHMSDNQCVVSLETAIAGFARCN